MDYPCRWLKSPMIYLFCDRYLYRNPRTLPGRAIILAAGDMFLNYLEMKHWTATALANMGRLKESYPLFQEIFAQDENWRTLLPRLVGSQLIKQEEVEKILKKVK